MNSLSHILCQLKGVGITCKVLFFYFFFVKVGHLLVKLNIARFFKDFLEVGFE